ncbi:MAG TPA: ferrochelatase [Oceanospirillales bacterium]|nr:ferrochelatase [Oceanospirillales bacterium]
MVNLGTPEAPTPKAVRAYLKEFLSDVRVVDAPRLIWWFVLRIILLIRPKPVSEAYKSIWTSEGSPLLVISKRQAAAVEARLKEVTGNDIPVELAMTYGNPSILSASNALRSKGVERILILPMYPQFSSSTTAAIYDKLSDLLKRCPHLPEMRWIRDFHDNPDYINALAKSVKTQWEKTGQAEKLLMSFHGVPERYTNKGDPYEHHCRKTADLLAAKLELKPEQWQCCFQSRFGREEWVKPYTDYTLKQWGKDGIKSVDIICPAFSADCLETLEEIQVENKEYFIEAGGESYNYIPALNDNPDHIDMLSKLIIQHSQGWE